MATVAAASPLPGRLLRVMVEVMDVTAEQATETAWPILGALDSSALHAVPPAAARCRGRMLAAHRVRGPAGWPPGSA